MYWQNKADYVIHATLSEKDTSITGDVTITYTNNSPDDLDYLWLQLEQNLFTITSKGTSMATTSDSRFVTKDFTSGMEVSGVSITHLGKTYTVQPRLMIPVCNSGSTSL